MCGIKRVSLFCGTQRSRHIRAFAALGTVPFLVGCRTRRKSQVALDALSYKNSLRLTTDDVKCKSFIYNNLPSVNEFGLGKAETTGLFLVAHERVEKWCSWNARCRRSRSARRAHAARRYSELGEIARRPYWHRLEHQREKRPRHALG